MTLVFFYPWRKGEPKKNRYQPRSKDTKPDLDNLEKQIIDVLERSGFFKDDQQIAQKHTYKWWSEQVSVKVRIEKCIRFIS